MVPPALSVLPGLDEVEGERKGRRTRLSLDTGHLVASILAITTGSGAPDPTGNPTGQIV